MAPALTPPALRAQLDTLRRELTRSKGVLTTSQMDDALRQRVAGRFDTVIARLEKRHETLTRTLRTDPLETTWRNLRRLQEDSTRVFDECLSLVEGALARERQVDDGICVLADSLLDDLSTWSDVPWGRFTLVGTSELYRETAGIIHVRFPELSAWSLSLAAHEFGHFVGPELREVGEGEVRYPFQDRSRMADEGRTPPLHTKAWYHLQEQFADLFATYALGPAFAAAFIMLRMNPTDEGTVTHPSGAQRVHSILWVLEKLEAEDGALSGSPLMRMAGRLRELWEENRRAVGQPEKLPDAEAARVTERVSDLWELLAGNTPAPLRYTVRDWWQAEMLASHLQKAVDDALGASPVLANVTRRDVLNGMWLARLLSPTIDARLVNEFARLGVALYAKLPSPERHVASTPGN